MLAATVVCVAASLAACAALVGIGKAVFPSTAHFGHFQFSDYGTLTVVGVLAACAGWPIVTRISWAPRWLFARLAVLVTVLLWLPDVVILVEGENPRGVAVLMSMHLAIALVTYQTLVRMAPARAPVDIEARDVGTNGPSPTPSRPQPPAPSAISATSASGAVSGPEAPLGALPISARRAWDAMAVLVCVELVLGVACIVLVPPSRATSVVPSKDGAIYLAHASIGLVLGIGALVLLVLSGAAGRIARIGARLGAVGVGIAGVGGVLSVFHHLRIVGMALMLLGTVAGGFGYLLPALDAFGESERQRIGLPPQRPDPAT
jgi:hypothetical protein